MDDYGLAALGAVIRTVDHVYVPDDPANAHRVVLGVGRMGTIWNALGVTV